MNGFSKFKPILDLITTIIVLVIGALLYIQNQGNEKYYPALSGKNLSDQIIEIKIETNKIKQDLKIELSEIRKENALSSFPLPLPSFWWQNFSCQPTCSFAKIINNMSNEIPPPHVIDFLEKEKKKEKENRLYIEIFEEEFHQNNGMGVDEEETFIRIEI